MPRLTVAARRKSVRQKMKRCGNVKRSFKVTDSKTFKQKSQDEAITSSLQDEATSSSMTQTKLLTSSSDLQLMEVSEENFVPDEPRASTSKCTRTVQETLQGVELNEFIVSGRRIVDIGNFFQNVITFRHLELFSCTNEHLVIAGEQRIGLESKFILACKMCNARKTVSSDNPQLMNINEASVLGTVATGGGYSQLREFLAICDIPQMGPHLYTRTEKMMSSYIHDTAWELIENAGKEEARLAIEEGRIDSDNIPMITVIADGAWSKRSYKVNYNASSGVAVIIGQKTGKLLFLGIRNKYCCVCVRAKSKSLDCPEHLCFKNWDKPSTGMEADIILEGFLRSVEMHNLKYVYLVGDGDSSVTKKLTEARPYGNRLVQKIECCNHLLRNFCTKLRDLVQKRISSKKIVVPIPQRNVLNNSIKRLRNGIQGAIKHASENAALSHSVKLQMLRKDVLNGPSHVFGDHSSCSAYFCDKKTDQLNWIPDMKDSGLYQDIMVIVDRIARNAESLVLNMNNNAAECYNAVLSKFIGGKRINFSARRSYQTRCEAAAISYNAAPGQLTRWIHKKAVNRSPGKHTKTYIKSLQLREKWKKSKRQLFPEKFKKAKKVPEPADEEYGAVVEDKPLSAEEYKLKEGEMLLSISKSHEEIAEIQINTIGQRNSLLWRQERSVRLTASNFGNICKMRKSTHCRNLVKTLLYSQFFGTSATRWGEDHEIVAIKEFEENYNYKVNECGLFIDENCNFLAATPDGLIGDDALIEVKCPSSSANYSPIDGIRQKKVKFAEERNGTIHLKRNHNYYYQVQGQLHITNRNKCFFIVWTPHGLEVEVIYKDEIFWKQNMELQLQTFFSKCLLPEMIDPQYPKKLPIKDLR